MDFKDMTVGEFARGIGAELPVAGGGSAAALSGAYGAAMQNGLKAAVQTPLEVAEKSVKALALCREAIEKGNRNAGPDALVGALLLRAAILGAVYNIRINVKTITDEPYRREMLNRAKDLEETAIRQEAEILSLLPELTHTK